MKSFTIELHHENHILELFFNKVQNAAGSKFYVTATSQKTETISFDLKMDIHGDWNVVAPAPLWIKQLELQFNQLLKEQTRYSLVYN